MSEFGESYYLREASQEDAVQVSSGSNGYEPATTGSLIVTAVPPPTSLLTVTVPLCNSTIW